METTARFAGPSPPPGDSDDQLMARLAGGDVDALDLLLSRYWAVVADFAVRVTGDLDEAEDLAQEAFMALWAGRRGWSGDTRPRALLLRMVRNRSMNENRSREVRRRAEPRVRRIETARRPPDPAQLFDGRELERAFREAFENLSPRRREVFELARFHGLSYEEIAEVMGTSPQTVANQMSAALRALRAALAPSEPGRDASVS